MVGIEPVLIDSSSVLTTWIHSIMGSNTPLCYRSIIDHDYCCVSANHTNIVTQLLVVITLQVLCICRCMKRTTCNAVLVVGYYIVYHHLMLKNNPRYVHHSSEHSELPYSLTCTSSSKTKSLWYFIVEILFCSGPIKMYTCVVCACKL